MKRMNAANDPSADPIITFAMRYTLPFALAGFITLLVFVAWLLSQ